LTRARDVANVLSTATSLATDTETAAAISSHNTAGNGHFARGTTANRPGSPAVGDLYFDTTLNGLVQYTEYEGWKLVGSVGSSTFTLDYLVIAGGGGGGGSSGDAVAGGGGAGAGGYRTSAGVSGGGSAAESTLTLNALTAYTVTVGSGGTAGTQGNVGGKGNNSVFATITSLGGGAGRDADDNNTTISNGGSGGGASGSAGGAAGTGTTGQGTNGGTKNDTNAGSYAGGGGGGSGGAASGRTRGVGTASSITGTSVTRAEGGYGQGTSNFISAGVSGAANTGNGGNGANNGSALGGAGGSGVVILRYPSTFTITVDAGLTQSTSTSGNNKITTITAGTGNVSFA
jgi:hypothetical protein